MNSYDIKGYLIVFFMILVAGVCMGIGWSTATRHYEVTHDLYTQPPSSCKINSSEDGCSNVLGGEYGKDALFGFPVAVWGTALSFTLFITSILFAISLVLESQTLTLETWSSLAALSLISFSASGYYLCIIYFELETECFLCFVMHSVNFIETLLVLCASMFLGGPRRAISLMASQPLFTKLFSVGAPVIIWLVAATGITHNFDDRFSNIEKLKALNPHLVQNYERIMNRCPSDQCLEPLVFPKKNQPDMDHSLVFRKSQTGPTLVQLLDMSCAECKAEYNREWRRVYQNIITGAEGELGFRVVLTPKNRDCNILSPVCDANTALICAFDKGPEYGMNYMDIEFMENSDRLNRKGWLEKNMGSQVAECYAKERSNLYPRLKSHIREKNKLEFYAKERCADNPGAWWCFTGTPSFGIFTEVGTISVTNNPHKINEAQTGLRKKHFLWDCLKNNKRPSFGPIIKTTGILPGGIKTKLAK